MFIASHAEYDGLVSDGSECACKPGHDFMPCFSDGVRDCEVGHEVPCPGSGSEDGGEGCEWGDECSFHIKAGPRPAAVEAT